MSGPLRYALTTVMWIQCEQQGKGLVIDNGRGGGKGLVINNGEGAG